MGIFQYQGKVDPLLPLTVPDSPALAWLPSYPDTVPHRRSRLQPTLFVCPQPVGLTQVRVSQAPLEDIFAYAQSLVRVSQAPIEILTQYALGVRQVRVSQAVVEVIYPFSCHVFVPPLPAACPVTLGPGANSAPCADEAPEFP